MAGTSYTRQSTITDGNLITASLFNNEYNQLLNAFVYSSTGTTGHTHDGTAGQGGAIGKIGDQDFNNKIEISATNNRIECYIEVGGSPVEQLRIQDGAIVPVTDSDIDFGTTSLRFKDAFVDSLTVTGVVTATGFTIGSAVITEAELEILDGKTFLDEDDLSSDSATGIPSQQSVKAYVDAQVTAQDLDLTDGTTSISIDLDSESLSVLGGTGMTSTASGNGVTLAIDSTVATLTGSQTLTNKTLTSPDVNTPDIDGGTIDGAIIGGTTAAAGSFTTVDATGNITVGGTVDGRDVAADGTKLDTVETNADVTDTTNVTAAGALMDSEVTNLAQVKAFDSTDYATAAQGTTADAALPRTGGAMTGAITTNSTFDGRDVATDGTKLDGIEASADVTDTANVTAAGALMDSELTSIASVKALNQGVATTDSPTFAAVTSTGEITANGGIALGDNDKATFGASDDLQIYHDGTHSYVDDSSGTGRLIFKTDYLEVQNAAGNEAILGGIQDGAVSLFYDGNTKLATTSTGIDVTGTASATNVSLPDDGVLSLGTSDELTLKHHNSGYSHLINTTGTLYVDSDSVTFRDDDGSPSNMVISQTGIDVTGTATMDGLTVDGNDSYTSNIKFDYGASAPTYFANWGYKSSSDGNKVFLTITDGGAAKDVLVANYNGNVGIGTSIPSTKLHLGGTAPLDSIIRQDSTVSGTNWEIGEREAGKWQIFEDDSDSVVATFMSSGNVGIGETDPDSTLTVKGSAHTNFQVKSNSESTKAFIQTVQDSDVRIGSSTNHPVSFYQNGAERMRIDSSGNVGIGVAPAFPFHVQASDGTLAQFSNGVDADCTIRTASGVTLITPSTGTLALGTSSTERMRIDSSGQLLLGRGANVAAGAEATRIQFYNTNSTYDIASIRSLVGAGQVNRGELSFAVNNGAGQQERMRIDYSGNVALMTDGADIKLYYTEPRTFITNSGPSVTIKQIDNHSTGAYIDFAAWDNSSLMRLMNSGNVGINNSSPPEMLTIGSTSDTNVRALFLSSTTGAGTIQFGDGTGASAYSGYINYTHSDNALAFATGSTERMRISSAGSLMVNSTTNFGKFVVENGGNSYPSWFRNTSSSIDYPNRIMSNYATGGQTATMLQFLNGSSAAVGAIKSTASATSYVTSSDQRLKENIADADDAGSKVDAIQVRKFDWKADGSHQDYGMIAQELQAVAPEAVSGDADSEEMMGVDYSKLVPMLIKEIQSLRNRVAQLEE